MVNFNKQFFDEHQDRLLKIANSKWLRWLLGVNRLPKEIKGKISKITPNSVHTIIGFDGIEVKEKGYFFMRPRFAETLSYNLSPVAYLQIPQRPVWRLSLVGALGMLACALFPKLIGGFAFIGTTTNYPISGDGAVRTSSQASWANAHDATSGGADYTSTAALMIYTYYYNSNYGIARAFFPADTSGLTSGATITAGELYFYTDIEVSMSDTSQGVYIVQTFQNSTSALQGDDWVDCGSDNGNAGRANQTSIQTGGSRAGTYFTNTGTWYSIVMDETGRGWINKTGVTKIGVREGFDLTNTAIGSQKINSIYIRWSPYTGSTYDPYLAVTYTSDMTVNVTDQLTTSESTTAENPLAGINVNDAISMTENLTLDNSNLGNINISDIITISENWLVNGLDFGISVYEELTTSESVVAINSELGPISISEQLTLSESVVMDAPIEISLSESVSLSEYLRVPPIDLGAINVTEQITVTDVKTMNVSEAKQGFTMLRSKQQSYPVVLNSKQQNRPVTLKDRRVM